MPPPLRPRQGRRTLRRQGSLAEADGFEPPIGGIKIRCLAAWLRPKHWVDGKRIHRPSRVAKDHPLSIKDGWDGGLRPPHAARAARGSMPAALPARAHPGIWRRLFGEASKNPFVRGTAPQGARDDLSHAKASPRPLPPPRDKSACVPRRSPRQSKTRPAPRPWSRNAPGLWRPPSSTAPQRQASSAACCRTA